MKPESLTFIVIFFSSLSVLAQVTAGQVDDFGDGMVQGWVEGAFSPNPPTNIATGGPLGTGDNFLENISSGSLGPGGKMIMFNTTQWTGNYTSQSIIAIKFDVKVVGVINLNLRVAFQKTGSEQISTTSAVTIVAGGGWESVTIPISASDFTIVTGATTADNVLTSVTVMRILSSVTPSWNGDAVAATLHIDNIRASTSLGLEDKKLVDMFYISPNPSSSRLNIILPSNINDISIEVFDILGKRIFRGNTISSSFNVSSWNSGVYLVKVSNEISTQTKRFIKQ